MFNDAHPAIQTFINHIKKCVEKLHIQYIFLEDWGDFYTSMYFSLYYYELHYKSGSNQFLEFYSYRNMYRVSYNRDTIS